MSTTTIEQLGVPMPPIDNRPKNAKPKYPLATMTLGGMLFFPGRSSKSLSAYISRIAKKHPSRKFSVRSCWMWLAPDDTWQVIEPGQETQVAGATKGAGVWRIE